MKLKEGSEVCIFFDKTFVGYEKHYYRKDSFIDGIQFYKAYVEFLGLDTVSGVLHISADVRYDNAGVYASDGSLVKSYSLVQEIDVSGLPAGRYSIVFSNHGQVVLSQYFIKQR